MPHRCVRCGKIYENTSDVILKGCECGSHYFFFFKADDVRLRQETDSLTRQERDEIMEDVKEMVGETPDTPVVLDLESIRVRKAGKFEIDLVNLFKRKPVVYKLEDGKYIIDIHSTFQLMKHTPANFEDQVKEEIDVELEEKENKEEKEEKKASEQESKNTDKETEHKEKKSSHHKEEHKEKPEEEYVEIPKELQEEIKKAETVQPGKQIANLETQDDVEKKIKKEI